MALGYKTGGRQKGSINKRSASVMEVLARNNFDIIQELVDLYKECRTSGEPAQTAIKCLEVMLPYCYPKLNKDINVDMFLMQRIQNLSLQPKDELLKIAESELKRLQTAE